MIRPASIYKSHQSPGFSLIEVLFALVIFSTVAISMIAILPTGFDNVREAANLSVVSRIIQTVTSDAQSSDWDEFADRFSNPQKQFLFFDDQGNRLEKTGVPNHIYTARIEIVPTPNSTAPNGISVVLPGDTTSKVGRATDLRKLLIKITTIPGEQGIKALKERQGKARYTEHFAIVAAF